MLARRHALLSGMQRVLQLSCSSASSNTDSEMALPCVHWSLDHIVRHRLKPLAAGFCIAAPPDGRRAMAHCPFVRVHEARSPFLHILISEHITQSRVSMCTGRPPWCPETRWRLRRLSCGRWTLAPSRRLQRPRLASAGGSRCSPSLIQPHLPCGMVCLA